MNTCADCGCPLDDHDLDARFALPDVLVGRDIRVSTPGVWMSGASPEHSEALSLAGVGAWIRALLRVHLTDDRSMTYGVWVSVERSTLARAGMCWHTARYRRLTFDGLIANRVEPWDLLDAPARVAVRDPQQIPWVVSSTDASLAGVLTEVWPDELVTAPFRR